MTDPIGEQLAILENVNLGTKPVVDTTNPYSVLLEQIVAAGSEVKQNLLIQDRRIHASQARTTQDLYYHLSDEDGSIMHSLPSVSNVTLFIPVLELVSNGIYSSADSSYTISIPTGTSVIAGDTNLLITSDVEISLTTINDNKQVWASTVNVDEDSLFSDVGVIPTSIITIDSVEWVTIKVPVIQGELTIYEIIVGDINLYEETFDYPNRFYKLKIEKMVDDTLVKIPQYFIESKYDADVPSVYTSIGNSVSLKIPFIFTKNNILTGKFRVSIYTTNGKTIKHLSNVTDWDVKLGLATTVLHKAASLCTIRPMSDAVLDGGTNGTTFKDLKNKILYRLVNFDTPITARQLAEVVKRYALTLSQAEDGITSRTYLALADNNSNDGTHINYSATLQINDTNDMPQGVITTTDYSIIDSQVLTKESNGKVGILTVSDKLALQNLTYINFIKELNREHYLTTIFRNIVDYDKALSVRTYDVDNPTVLNVNIMAINKEAAVTANVNNIEVFLDKSTNTYVTMIELIGTQGYSIDKVKLALSIKSNNEQITILSEGTLQTELLKTKYSLSGDWLAVKLELDYYINSDNECRLINGVTDGTKKIFNSDDMDLYIYTDDNILKNSSSSQAIDFLSSEITLANAMILTKEKVDLELYKAIPYIWNNTTRKFNERKFSKYTIDVPLLHSSIVYKVDPYTGCTFTLTDTNGDGTKDTATREILFNIGDPVVDQDGNPVLKHKKGDLILSPNGEPIIINNDEVILETSVYLSEYEYTVIDSTIYRDDKARALELIRSRLFDKMELVNDVTLDNTIIKLRSKNTLDKVVDIYGNEYDREPVVDITVYVESNAQVVTETSIREVFDDIGPVELSKSYIDIEAIEEILKGKLPITTVELKIDSLGKLTRLAEGSNRFVLPKQITSSAIIQYDYNVSIITL